jgi:hypothetical protein
LPIRLSRPSRIACLELAATNSIARPFCARAAGKLTALACALGWSSERLRTPAVRQNEGPSNALLATLGYAQVSEVVTVFGE